jgi:hypothetical protein
VMESRVDPGNVSRPGSSSSMASVRPTNVFATPDVPTTPKKKKTIYGDRFIPNREGVDLQASFSLLESPNTSPSKPRRKHSAREIDAQRGNPTFSHCIVLTRQKMRRRIIYTELSSRMKCLETNYQQIQQ